MFHMHSLECIGVHIFFLKMIKSMSSELGYTSFLQVVVKANCPMYSSPLVKEVKGLRLLEGIRVASV